MGFFCNFLLWTIKYFFSFDHKNLKNPPLKDAQKYSSLFSPIVAQTAQIEEFIFQNVAYIATVYRTEGYTVIWMDRKCPNNHKW